MELRSHLRPESQPGGTITNSAAGSAKNFTVNNSNTSSSDGVVSGNLNLVKNGTGLLTLTGANTYTGDTKDLGGTLSISSRRIWPMQLTCILRPARFSI